MLDDGLGVARVVLVGGTHSWRGTASGQWYAPDSDLVLQGLRPRGLAPVLDAQGHPFVWQSGAYGWRAWRTWIGLSDMSGWQAAALHLRWFIGAVPGGSRRLPGVHTAIVCHSHAIQPVLIAAAQGLIVQTLIDVGGPIREDVIREYGARARPNIRYWLSVHEAGVDWWRSLGGIGDGHVGARRQHPLVTRGPGGHLAIPGIGHSGLLTNPARWPSTWDAIADLIRSRDGRDEGPADPALAA